MTLAKLINDKRLSAFAVVIGAPVATTLAAPELADQSPLSFLWVAAFMRFVYLACRIFEWCDADNVHAPSFANRTGAIAARSWLANIGITIIRSVRAAPKTGSLCAVARAGQARMRSSKPGRSGSPGCSSRGGRDTRYFPRSASGPVKPFTSACLRKSMSWSSQHFGLRLKARSFAASRITADLHRRPTHGLPRAPLLQSDDPPGALQLAPRNTLRSGSSLRCSRLGAGLIGEGLLKRRHEFYLDAEVSERLATMAAKPGSSKTAIMTDALKGYFDRAASTELDDRFKARLDKLSVQLGRLERDQEIVAEALALLARFQFSVTAPLSASDQAARSMAQDRFKAFIDQVSRRISSGRGLTEQILALTSAPETTAGSV
jgi:predicted transcriptional regulator